MAVASLFEDLLDQYRIEQQITEKRYTNLYQAYDVDDDRHVRLDILRAEYAEDSSFAGRFVNRARALAQVRHSNIAPVLHIGKAAGDAPYVVQATIDGYPLTRRLDQLAQRETPVNPIYALELIHQLADALILAERLELLHYDLQPDNILLKNVTLPADDTVVLIDLFIPNERHPRAAFAAEDPAKLAFLSPEQRTNKEMTAAAHVYSLGAILYRLLVGRLPNGPVSRTESVLRRVIGRPTQLERERSDLSPATYALIERSLRKDPGGRYPNAESFLAALESALVAEESRLGATTGRVPIIDRRPLAWLLPLLIVALLLAVGAVATRSLVNRSEGQGEATRGSVVTASIAEQTPQATLATHETVVAQNPTATAQGIATATEINSAAGVGVPATTSARPVDTSTPAVSPSTTPTEEPTATVTLTPSPQSPRVRVMHNLVNLRRGPGVVFSVVGNVVGGDLLEVLAWNDDEDNPWYLVVTEDQRIGWIADAVIQPESVEALAAVPPAATLPPTPFPTTTPTPTATIANVITIQPTVGFIEPGNGSPTRPPVDPTEAPTKAPTDAPTDAPTEPPPEPTRTPPPFTPSP